MSPEQARGKTVDKRADLWAFGAILYEIVTGKPLFSGETVTEVLAQVIAGEPDISDAPAELFPVLRRCLNATRRSVFAILAICGFYWSPRLLPRPRPLSMRAQAA